MRKIKLYPHNLMAYEKAVKMLKEEGKAAIIHPTGTGKSFIAFALACDNQDKSFLWLSPSEYIYRLQCKNLWQNQHMKLTNIDFHTYSWLIRNDDIIDELKADYIILDEFHRTGAHEWEKRVRKLIKILPHAKILGLSATKVRYLDNKRDMADEIFEGCIASEINICEAMAAGILPKPKYVIASYSYEQKLLEYESRASGLSNRKQKENTQKLIRKLRAKLQNASGMDRIFEKHLTKRDAKLILFCSNAEHMMEIIAQVPDWFGKMDIRPHVYHVSSYNPESEATFELFTEDDSDHLKLLFCIDMLNEGIHVDEVDAVVLCRPTHSPIVYKQQIGRAIAVGVGKRPIIFDVVNNFDSLCRINEIKQELEKYIPVGQYEGREDGDEYPSFEVIDELRDCRELLEEIQKNLDATWDTYYQELCRYREEKGNCDITRRYKTEEGLWLGKWMLMQKTLYREGKLTEDKISALEEIDICWEYRSDVNFNRNVELLKKYKEEHGSLFLTKNYTTPDGVNLANWCTNIRKLQRAGKLPENRSRILDEMGFLWNVDEAVWDEGYKHAKAYYEEHGAICISRRYICKDGYRLGQWLSTQRSIRLGRRSGNLTKEKIMKLNELNMDWSDKNRDHFDEYLAVYKEHAANGGNSVLPLSYVTKDGLALGKWCSMIRSQYRMGTLHKFKEKRLKEAGFEFHNFPFTWYMHWQEAKRYYEKYGSLIIKKAYLEPSEYSLPQWVNAQKREYKKENHGVLNEEQVRLLEEININTGNRVEVAFNKGVKALDEYVKKYGNTLVPNVFVTADGFGLGGWIAAQKTYYKNKKLATYKISALNELGMVWENTETVKTLEHWNKMYKVAEKYASEHGSIRNVSSSYITESGEKLGSWIAQQRRVRKGNLKHSVKMTDERIVMLDKIGMNWGKIFDQNDQKTK